jgi:hypothetical protein
MFAPLNFEVPLRPLFRCAIAFAILTSLAEAAAPVHPNTVAIVLDFRGPHSMRSIQEMKRELDSIMKGSGLTFDFRTREDAAQETFDNLVVVRFDGKCILEPDASLYDERGPYAFTYSTNGALQPFSEVVCDRVTASVRSAMSGSDFGQADRLLGRALGRVVAHEMVHMLARSDRHARDGVTKAALSGNQLISGELKLPPEDMARIRALGR